MINNNDEQQHAVKRYSELIFICEIYSSHSRTKMPALSGREQMKTFPTRDC